MGFEVYIIKILQSCASTNWITFFQAISMLGSFLGFFITFFILFIKNRKLSIVFAFAFCVACIGNTLLKRVIQRTRPFEHFSFIHNYANEDGFSFPSGHSVCAGLFATFLTYHLFCEIKDNWTRIFGVSGLLLLTILIAFSRMVLGVHYLSDIIVGIIVGIIVAILCICVYNICIRKSRERRERQKL
ncbi:MAG: phosphatase PAP2 family protein [Clostridiales bacterium]|nr:phosphatase PAP2 family protein [Clostridiales bacterium]